jgi:hypothetical protein
MQYSLLEDITILNVYLYVNTVHSTQYTNPVFVE